MKMEHVVRASTDGVVADVRVAKGQHVENGTLLLVFEPADDPDSPDGEDSS
jgi:biotin carboxyl carrier protein